MMNATLALTQEDDKGMTSEDEDMGMTQGEEMENMNQSQGNEIRGLIQGQSNDAINDGNKEEEKEEDGDYE